MSSRTSRRRRLATGIMVSGRSSCIRHGRTFLRLGYDSSGSILSVRAPRSPTTAQRSDYRGGGKRPRTPGELAARVLATMCRIIRDTRFPGKLKTQVPEPLPSLWGMSSGLGLNGTTSEGHHLRPLGHPHDGPYCSGSTSWCCAPPITLKSDYGAIAIDPADGVTIVLFRSPP